MEGFDLLSPHYWQPFAQFGIHHSFFNINSATIIATWVVLIAIFILLLPLRFILSRKKSTGRFLILSFINSFVELTRQTLGKFSFNHFCFITALFSFIFCCNALSIVPGLEEPTTDLNTTLALGITGFLYTQFYSIKTHGLLAYIKEYFSPFFIMLPLNIVGKVASIISISFRLFGNIFGGATIGTIYMSVIKGAIAWELIGILSGVNFTIMVFFGLFEGFLQAFVFAMLTLTYLSIALQDSSGETI